MNKDSIHAIVYTDFHDQIGPNPIYWYPTELSENVRMLVGIKTVTLLSASHGFVPESLIIIPFPSIRLKGIIKYIEREDNTRRGGAAQYAITFLFKESDDVIFYKYITYLDSLFSETARKIIDFENSSAPKHKVFEEINILRTGLITLLEYLRSKELSISSSRAFPEGIKPEEKFSDFKFKLTVLGDPGVGKTSTILRFTDNAFNRTYIPTMGVNITDKNFRVNNHTIEIVLWDIAGQSKFQLMRKHFYQGTEAILLIFDLTNPQSFESVREWYKDIKKYLPEKTNLVGYIFGNKIDLINERKVNEQEGISLAKELHLEYIETSALTGQNVENAFYNLAKTLIKLKNIPPMNN